MEENRTNFEEMENEESVALMESEIKRNKITSFSGRKTNSQVTCETISTIQDKIALYNLTTGVDFKLNDCIGEKIRIKDIVIRFFEKPAKEVTVDEETGEVHDIERTLSCVLIAEDGQSYATGSKSFTYQLLNFMQGGYVSEEEIREKGLEIEIIKKNIPNSNNKALGFKVLQ